MYRLLVLTRRSLTAATDAIGACCFNGGLYNLRVPSRDCHVASLLAMTNLKASCRRIIVPILAVANGAQGTPYRRNRLVRFIVALYELQMPDTPFYADFTSCGREKYGAVRENPYFSACFAAKTAYNGRKACKRITSQEKPTNAPEIFRNS